MTRILPKAAFGALAIATLITLPLLATARPGGGPGGGHGLERAIENLDLDEQTRASVFEILDARKPESRAFRQKIRDARKAMLALLEADTPDEAAIMAAADEVGALKTEASKQRLRTMLAVSALLTPEQRAQLREQRRERHERRKGRKDRKGGMDREDPGQEL